MDGFVMHMFYNEFIICIFQLTPMLLVLRNFMHVYGEEL